MKQFLLFAGTLFLASHLLASGLGQSGNGAGGGRIAGKVMTFYSMQIVVEPEPKTAPEIPTLEQTIQFFLNTPYLDMKTKAALVKALSPQLGRQYFNISESDLDPKRYDELLNEYQKASKLPKEQLVIFAVTDVRTDTTFILPSFYNLTPNEQMAVLLHEALWILMPESKVETIIEIEKAFQAYLDHRQPQLFVDFADKLPSYSNELSSVVAAIQLDLHAGVLRTFAPNGRVSLAKLVGSSYLECLSEVERARSSERVSVYSTIDCRTFWDLRMLELQKQYPNSMIIRQLSKARVSWISDRTAKSPLQEHVLISKLKNVTVEFYSKSHGPFLHLGNYGWVMWVK